MISKQALKQILYNYEFRNWDEKILLIPYKYYDHLPMGLVLTAIDGDKITVTPDYKNNKSANYIDNDYRGGLLAFGVTEDEYEEAFTWMSNLNYDTTQV